METWNASCLYPSSLILGEGAHWHAGWKKFLFVDIDGKTIGAIDLVSKKVTEKKIDKKAGAVVPTNGDKLIVALQGSIEIFDFEKGLLKKISDVEPGKPDNRSNEGKCDAAGRLWLGTMHADAYAHKGALYKLDGGLIKMLDHISVSNGMCWTRDNKTMYYIDSFDYNIKAYDFDVADGTISNERIVVTIADHSHIPDGMCIDEDGMLWVAIWGGGAVHRYDPGNGQLIGRVLVDAPHVTSCAFGGETMKQLFITTARKGLDDEQLLKYPNSGALFIVDLPYAGLHPNAFADAGF